MQRIQFALFQIDEAKNYITSGRLPALRLALMLLDNTVEVLLDRWIADDIGSDLLWEKLQNSARKAGIPETEPQFSDLYQRRFLSGNEKKKVARFFCEKIKYVTEIKNRVSPSIGAVLSHLHRYRNEAYHLGKVRPETLKTSAMILLEMCCHLIETLKPGSICYDFSDDYSWLEERFNWKRFDLWNQNNETNALAEFRKGISIGNTSFRETLVKNLENRLEGLNERLAFISHNRQHKPDFVAVLEESQNFTLAKLKKTPSYQNVPPKLDEPVTIDQLNALRFYSDSIRNASDAVKSFETYAVADTVLERIEFIVNQLADAINNSIQLAIDLARGK